MHTANALTWVQTDVMAGSDRFNDAWTWAEPRSKRFAGINNPHETGPRWTELNADTKANAHSRL